MQTLRTAIAIAAVGAFACKTRKPRSDEPDRDRAPSGAHGTGEPDLDRAIALGDHAASGVATWPAGTNHLVPDRVIAYAVDHGDELIAAAKGALLRIPKDGGPVTALAEFPDAQILDLRLTSGHAIVGV